MRVVQYVEFSPDGSLGIRWVDSDEQGPEGSDVHETRITQEGREMYDRVGYYADEVHQDVAELLEWWLKYRRGIVPNQ